MYSDVEHEDYTQSTSKYRIYCSVCDKFINKKYKQKHIKSESHSYMYNNIVTNKYNIANVYWVDFEKTIEEYIKENKTKFYSFSIAFKCKLNDEDIYISDDNILWYVPAHKFSDSKIICYESRILRDYIFHRAMLRDIKLDSFSMISDVTITLFSSYNSMTLKHKLRQPRRVLESKLLKHIKNASFYDKIHKYNFLTYKYKLLF